VLSDVAAMGIPQVTFRGGEAFLRPDFCDLLEYAGQRGLRISIISNGTIMNDEIARRVIQAPTASMTISVDGPRAIHDTIRRVPGMLDRIESNIRCLRQAQRELGLSRPRIYINCTLSATNQGHLQGLVDIAARHQATLTLRPLFYTTERQQEQTNRLYRMGNAKPECQVLSPNLSHVNPSALAQELMKVRQYATSLKVDIRISLRNVRQIFNRFYRAYHADAGRCMHPWRVTTINPYGAVYPCSINTVMGDIRRQTLSQIWNGRKYVHFRQRLASVGIFPRCTKCCVLDADDLLARILPRGTNGGA
jgi:radical SAM protein with 4Fe4S-binding SPASM domain